MGAIFTRPLERDDILRTLAGKLRKQPDEKNDGVCDDKPNEESPPVLHLETVMSDEEREQFVKSRMVYIQMSDDFEVILRPVLPNDKKYLQSGLERLSEQSRFFRFCSPMSRLSGGELKYLTEVDFYNHFAVIAADISKDVPPPGRGMGVARYVRIGNSDEAEIAVVVNDEYQSRGIGYLLIHTLAISAYRNGIRSMRAYVHPANHRVQTWVKHTHSRQGIDECGSTYIQMDLPLPPLPERLKHLSSTLERIQNVYDSEIK